MAENVYSGCFFHIDQPFETVHLSNRKHFDQAIQDTEKFPAHYFTNNPLRTNSTKNPIQIVPEGFNYTFQNPKVCKKEQPCIVKLMYPQDLYLSPVQKVLRRGRPKKTRSEQVNSSIISKLAPAIESFKILKTRSGRQVKFPKYIEKDFLNHKIFADEKEIKIPDINRFQDKVNLKTDFTEKITKRIIPSQYKCPKCLKAYLGKNKMIQHLRNYPDHGPFTENFQEFNFDVWNYLFDITQKCKSGQRGVKFCEELSNLLHNLQLLKSALFKNVIDNKSCVQIDKVLGNAIGLEPGKYRFDENELYKDVTVLKLITNSNFFKPISNKEVNDSITTRSKVMGNLQIQDSKNQEQKQFILKSYEIGENKSSLQIETSRYSSNRELKPEENTYNFIAKSEGMSSEKVNENMSTFADSSSKKLDIDHQTLSSDLLTEDLLLQSTPNSRNSVEELMLTSAENCSSNLLDNSTSLDEVMNVDQFVNERFKKIIESDLEISSTSLNLDLPSLELFQFHTS